MGVGARASRASSAGVLPRSWRCRGCRAGRPGVVAAGPSDVVIVRGTSVSSPPFPVWEPSKFVAGPASRRCAGALCKRARRSFVFRRLEKAVTRGYMCRAWVCAPATWLAVGRYRTSVKGASSRSTGAQRADLQRPIRIYTRKHPRELSSVPPPLLSILPPKDFALHKQLAIATETETRTSRGLRISPPSTSSHEGSTV